MQENATIEPPKKFSFRYIGDNENFLSWAFLLPAVLYIVLLVGIPFVLAIHHGLNMNGHGVVGLPNVRLRIS